MTNRCVGCCYPITWDTQRRQYGRAIKAGLAEAEAKALMPRCQKCMTKALRVARGPNGPNESQVYIARAREA
jgi:hypothetical protein